MPGSRIPWTMPLIRGLLIVLVPLQNSGPLRAEPDPPPLLEFGEQPRTIVCLGDSVTGVYYHTGGRRAYPEMLELAIRRVHPKAKVTVVNAGISGNTTEDGMKRLDRDVLGKKPDLVTVAFGLNDMSRVSEEQFRKNLETIAARCREAKSQVLFCTPNAVLDTFGRPTEKLVRYCAVIRAAARELKIPLCDQYRAGDELRQRDAWSWRLTMSDEIHPNMDGHKLMAQELCRVITGKPVTLDNEGPPAPALSRTLTLFKESKPVRVLAMPPVDKMISTALKQLDPNAVVEVTTWPTEGLALTDLEGAAKEKVRAMKPDLVVLAIPRFAAAESDEQFVRSYSWIMNWSLSFGHMEWDCIVVHPSVTAPAEAAPRDDLVRRFVKAQDLSLVDRPAGDAAPTQELFTRRLTELSRTK